MKLKALFIILLFFSTVFSQNQQSDNEMVEYIHDITNAISDAGDSFVATGRAAAVGGFGGVGSLFSAFEIGDCGTSWAATDPAGVIATWLSPAVVVVIAVSFCIAIVFMVGELLNSPQLIAVAKEEGFQTIITVLRILFIATAMYAGNAWYTLAHAPSLTHPIPTDIVYANAVDTLDAAMAFSRLMIADIAKNYSTITLFNMIVHIIYGATLWVGTNFRSMYNFNLGPVLKPFIDLLGIGTQMLSLALGEWMAHAMLLCFIKKWSWSIFIPAGVLLRAFPQTRDAGEAIFMLVMALGTIYPFMFVVDYEVHKLLSPNLVNPVLLINEYASRTGLLTIGGTALAMMLVGGGAIVPIVGGVVAVGTITLMESVVYYVVIMGLLLPFINIFITLTLAREWAKVFNVNVNYLSFMKII
ncbi:MAG: hypothetical protein QW171_03175 [Candidatus Bilamarchaeaceae archaeon]